jgi:predicted Zn-dependent protease
MIGSRAIVRGLQIGVMAVSLIALAACSTMLGPKVSVTQTGEVNAPAVPDNTDPDDSVIGRREHPRIIAAYGGVYEDRQAELMLASIVGRLLAAADQPNTRFTITILDSSEVNAFALPGGYVYVTRGILALASDSSELAGVLSHEIAHVTLRHARARTNRMRTSAIVDRVVTGVFGGDVETDQTSNRSKVSLAAFSQQQELEADREGVRIAGKAGFDPLASSRFLGVMGRFAQFSAGDAAQADDFLSTHPSTPDRIQKAAAAAHSFFGDATGDTDRDAYMAAIDGMLFGESPQNGAILGRRFIHPGLKFTFTVPEGYTLQTSKNAVVGVAGDGEAVRFDSAEVPVSMPLDEYLKSGWIAGLDANSVQKQSHNGIEMATGIAVTDQWHFRVSVARFNGEVYRFIFAAKQDSSRFGDGAAETLASFRPAGPDDLAQIRKVSVDVITARSGDTADSLARRMQNLTRGSGLFYILNNLFPGDPVVVGQKYKVVVLN